MPPEVIIFLSLYFQSFKSGSETSPAIDVWAIGVMIYAMLYGKLPFWGDSEEDFINKICTAPLKFENDIAVTEEMKEIMKSML
jgi:serine/threonine protein kinase